MHLSKLLAILVVILILPSACSKGGHDPVMGNIPEPLAGATSVDSLPVIAYDDSSAIGLLGAYNLTISPDGLNAELTPMRTPTIGESFIVSGKSYFATRPCVTCLRVAGIAMTSDNNVALGFWIKHPFPKGDTGKPPSGMNRLDLDLFDVAMVVAPVGATSKQFSKIPASAYTSAMANADGYTRELKDVVGDDAALPYKICYENINKNRFEMGKQDEYFYILFSKNTVSFNLYLTFGYGASAVLADRLNPTYYVPEYNRKAAWKVKITSAIWYGADPASIKIDIYDWNHGVTVASTYPDPVHRNYIKAASDIQQVLVEVPGMTNAVIEADTTDTHSNGWNDPITYNATFSNETGLVEGDYIGLVKVLDSRAPGSGLTGDSVVHTPDGVNLESHDLDEFATFQTFIATIAPPCGPVTGQITSPTCPITGLRDDDTVDFVVTASSANNGNPIVLYEADYDYDGVTFNVDASNTDGIFNAVGPFINPNCPDPIPVSYTVAFRAKDSCLHPNITVFATCEVTVDRCCGPITGEIVSPECPISGISNNQTIDFVVSASSDNGGDPIVRYEADWSYDGTTFNVEAQNTTGDFIDGGPFRNPNCPGSGAPATVTVAFRAVDSCSPPNTTLIATCDVTIDICAGWALTWGDTGSDQGIITATDSSGNMYVAGDFNGTVDFDPSDLVMEKSSSGQRDIFLSKFDSYGLFEWVLTWGGPLDDSPRDMVITPSGNIYITGLFAGTVNFDPTSGTDEHSSVADTPDIFLSALNTSGNYQWTRTWGGDAEDSGLGVAVQNTGNIIVGGYFDSTVDFDPDTGTTQRTTAGLSDIFVSTFDNAGLFVRVIVMGGWGLDEVKSVACDNSGNIYVTGDFMGQFDFDPGGGTDTHTSQGGMDIFLAKYDSSSAYVWALSWGAGGEDRGTDLFVTVGSVIYMTGFFSETVDFDPGAGNQIFASSGYTDAFLEVFNSDGEFSNVYLWGGSKDDKAFGLSIDDDYLTVCGSFSTTVDFDPGTGTDSHVSAGKLDAFASKFNLSDISYIGATTWGGTEDDQAYSTALDISSNVLVTGDFKSTVDFDPGPYTDNRLSNGDTDVFFVNLVI